MTSDTSPRPIISPRRARMIEDMSVRGFKEDTRRDYVRHVRAFAAFIGRSPDTATAEELRPFTTNIDPGDAAPAERRPSAPVFALDILAPAAARHARARRAENSAFILAAAAASRYAVVGRSAVVGTGGRSLPRGAVYFGRFPWLRLAGHHSPPSQGA